MKLTIYGCRAAIPFSSKAHIRYGGNTSCVGVTSKGQTLILDAGSGLTRLDYDLRAERIRLNEIHLLLGHLHLDHIIGLTMFRPVWLRNGGVHIYTKNRGGVGRFGPLSMAEQVFGAFVPPYWPVDMTKAAQARMHEIEEEKPFEIGVFHITPFKINHPDEATAFRISDGEKVLVYLTDHETGNKLPDPDIVRRCANADAVFFDSAYAPADYEMYRGRGHSTWADGLALAQACDCKKMIFGHISLDYTDTRMDALANKAGKTAIEAGLSERYVFARDGLTLDI